MSVPTTLAFLGEFGDGIEFIFRARESPAGGVQVGGAENLPLLWEHLKLSAASMGLALAVAVPVGLLLGHFRKGAFLAISASNVGRAVPSVALIALFVAFFPRTSELLNVIIALALLAIPPILTNAYVGVTQVNPETVDAARGMGFSEARIVRAVELPLALPLLFGGIKTSTVNVLATATIAPLVGVVTLGDPIIASSTYGRPGQIGASIMVAVLAISAELGLSAVQRAVTPAGIKLERGQSASRRRLSLVPRRVDTAS